jgi:hypothetical protein
MIALSTNPSLPLCDHMTSVSISAQQKRNSFFLKGKKNARKLFAMLIAERAVCV